MRFCVLMFSWAFIQCEFLGPGMWTAFDITGDGSFDMIDVALFQNSFNGETCELCCVDQICGLCDPP